MNEETKDCLKSYGLLITLSAVVGAISGFGLSFTALSPLVIGGIVSCVFPILGMIFCIVVLFSETLEKTLCIKKDVERKGDIKRFITGFGIAAVISAVVGIGSVAAANVLFPDVVLGIWSAALAGAVIAAYTQLVSLPAARFILDKVDELCLQRKEKYESC